MTPALLGYSTNTVSKLLGGEEAANVVYSPANLYLALSMLTETVDGETRAQLLDLHESLTFPEPVPHEGGSGHFLNKRILRRRQHDGNARMAVPAIHGAMSDPDPRHIRNQISLPMLHPAHAQYHKITPI